MNEKEYMYKCRVIQSNVMPHKHYCNESENCEAFCHVAWCPKDRFYKEWVEEYNKAPWYKKIFMNSDPRSAWF